MGKKTYFMLVDCETSQSDRVKDFAAVVCDRHGKIYKQMAVLVSETMNEKPFCGPGEFSETKQIKRYADLLNSGTRMVASVAAINRWLDKAANKFSPILTAYNLSFDVSRCANTGIDLTQFPDRFCLWNAAASIFATSKKYREFVLEYLRFNNVTAKGNMTYKTDAETMAGYLHNAIRKEPHTALEDIIDFEIPILKAVVAKKKWKSRVHPFDWKNHQVKNGFRAA